MTKHMFLAKAVLAMAFLVSVASVAYTQTSKNQVLKHVVSFQFKDEITKERQVQALEDFMALKEQIPEIQSFEGGKDVSVEGLNKGMTHCFILTFKDEAARDIYIPHPAHIKLADKNKPLMKDILVVDVWVTE